LACGGGVAFWGGKEKKNMEDLKLICSYTTETLQLPYKQDVTKIKNPNLTPSILQRRSQKSMI